jgi:hypothetical protein
MLPSLLSKWLKNGNPTSPLIQAQPISVGASTPSEALRYAGAPLPTLLPTALHATLTAQPGSMSRLQDLRRDALDDIYKNLYKTGTKAQQDYIDARTTSLKQLRQLNQCQLAALADLKTNTIQFQIQAAIALIQMQVSPVIAIHIPFGGDNHSDAGLQKEIAETTAAIQLLTGTPSSPGLLTLLDGFGLADKVTFASLNVFGRTIGPGNSAGRQHNKNHQVSLVIGKPFQGGAGVIGGVAPDDPKAPAPDYTAATFDPSTGAVTSKTPPTDSMQSFGRTLLAAVNAPVDWIGATGASVAAPFPGQIITAALAPKGQP